MPPSADHPAPRQRRLGRASIWASAAACVLVAIISWSAFKANSDLVESNRWTSHTFQVIAELRTIEAELRRATSESRTFVTTGDEYARTEFQDALAETNLHLRRARELCADNAVQTPRLDLLDGLIEARLAAMRSALEVYDARGSAAAQEHFASVVPPAPMRRISGVLDEMAQTEHDLLSDREAASTSSAARSTTVLTLGGAATLLILLGAAWMLWREGSARQRLEADLRSAIAAAERANADVDAANRRLQDANEGLISANKELEAFSYTVSHDLRAPLRSVDGFSRILLEEHAASLAPEASGYLRRVRAAAQQMGALIDDLLAFSRLGRQAIRTHEVDLGALAAQIVTQLRDEQPDRRIEVVIQPMPRVLGDATLLRQVLANLISNAFKFTRSVDNPSIQIGYQADLATPAYFVRDNGVGFDMQYVNKLFGVFQRLHRADQFEGTGVGLAIVHRIIQRHGGQVWAEGQLNHGAVFWFTLPGVPTP